MDRLRLAEGSTGTASAVEPVRRVCLQSLGDNHRAISYPGRVLFCCSITSHVPLQPVTIVGCGPIPTGGVVYAIAVSQNVQSWMVLRSHDDFLAVGQALSLGLQGLPQCPPLNNADMTQSRNELQHWLSSILMYPSVIGSPAVSQFLYVGANTTPPQYENVAWTQFPVAPVPSTSAPSASIANAATGDLTMDDVFGADEAPSEHENYEDHDDDFIPSAAERYKPTNEPITGEDEEDMMQLAGSVEMIDDVGSLAQSLGASHLGRSLMLQQELGLSTKPKTALQSQGLTLGGVSEHRGSGGLRNELAQAPTGPSDGFHQKAPTSPPRLDSFKLHRVIGKGSFGKSITGSSLSNACMAHSFRQEKSFLSARRRTATCMH